VDKDESGGADTALKQLRVSSSDSPATPPSGMAEAPQAERVFDRFGCVALVFYAAISVFVFARSLLSDFANSYVGQGPDPSASMWSLVWWPHAIAHRLNPFLTHAIFAPAGLNLAWRTTIPLASLLVSPITAAFGPVVAYNILSLASPPLAAWTAFILCRHIARSYWPALLGGYLFGFSAYMVGQTFGGHLHLVLVFAVPLAVYLPALWLDGALKSLRFVVLMGLTLAVQFALSVEIFTTAIMFGAMAIVLALAFTEGETRRRIGWMLVPVASSCVFAALLVSPCLYYMFAYPELRGPVWSLEAFSADVLNFLIPTETSALGHLAVANSISAGFSGNVFERDAFVGPALLAVIAAYARRHWRQPFGKLLIDSLIIICVPRLVLSCISADICWTVTRKAARCFARDREGIAGALHDVRFSSYRNNNFALVHNEHGEQSDEIYCGCPDCAVFAAKFWFSLWG